MYLRHRHSLHLDNLLAGFIAAFEGNLTWAQAEDFGEKLNERGVGLALDGGRAKPDFQNLAAMSIGDPTDNFVGLGAGLDAESEARHCSTPNAFSTSARFQR
jgi:hypothetical protein